MVNAWVIGAALATLWIATAKANDAITHEVTLPLSIYHAGYVESPISWCAVRSERWVEAGSICHAHQQDRRAPVCGFVDAKGSHVPTGDTYCSVPIGWKGVWANGEGGSEIEECQVTPGGWCKTWIIKWGTR